MKEKNGRRRGWVGGSGEWAGGGGAGRWGGGRGAGTLSISPLSAMADTLISCDNM